MADSVKADFKLASIDKAAQFSADFVRNPPRNALDVVRIAESAFSLSGTVGAGLAVAFPMVGTMLPILSSVFGMFSGLGGPSIGELTLTAIQQVSEQIAAGFNAVTETLTNVTTQQAQRTIDTVLSGVNELAREQSAVNIYKAFTASQILNTIEQKKVAEFAKYTEQLNAQRAQWVADIKSALQEQQAKTDQQYLFVQAQLAGIAGGLFNQVNDQLQKAASDGLEILEIQKQIDEINKYIGDGTLAKFGDALVRRFYGVN